MTINRARVAIDVEGLPEMPIAGLRLTDVIASGKAGMKAYNTTSLELHNVQVSAENGPAFQVKDSANLELDGIRQTWNWMAYRVPGRSRRRR
jgi:hypothetical protein